MISTDGTVFPALTVFSEAIKYLGSHLLEQLNTELGSEIKQEQVKWVLTVPAIWSDQAKFFMREAMYEVFSISN